MYVSVVRSGASGERYVVYWRSSMIGGVRGLEVSDVITELEAGPGFGPVYFF